MELTYRTVNGVQIPNLRLPKQKNLPIGKYGMMRHDFLEKHRKGTYTTLLTEFRLQEHLYEVDQEARRTYPTHRLGAWYHRGNESN